MTFEIFERGLIAVQSDFQIFERGLIAVQNDFQIFKRGLIAVKNDFQIFEISLIAVQNDFPNFRAWSYYSRASVYIIRSEVIQGSFEVNKVNISWSKSPNILPEMNIIIKVIINDRFSRKFVHQ